MIIIYDLYQVGMFSVEARKRIALCRLWQHKMMVMTSAIMEILDDDGEDGDQDDDDEDDEEEDTHDGDKSFNKAGQ